MLQITPSERTALQLLANGEATSAVAGGVGVREAEVDAYLATLFEKMGVASQSEAVAHAARRGLLAASDQRSGQRPIGLDQGPPGPAHSDDG